MTGFDISADSQTTPEMVRWAFHTILGHYVVSDDVVRFHQQAFPSFGQLCEGLKSSQEFLLRYGPNARPNLDATDAELRTVITSLYRTYLQREPDPAGMEEQLVLLRQWGGLAGVGELASVFEGSTERAIRTQSAAVMRWISAGNGPGDEFAGRPVISLGAHCAPSMILKKNELKSFSLPFDWVFSTPAMVRHCLQDDFRTFLDTRYHRSVFRPGHDGGVGGGSAYHTLYQKRFGITDPVFNHRDVTNPDHLGYYQRCVGRWRHLMRQRQPAFFLQCVIEAHLDEAACRAEFIATAKLLTKRLPGSSLAMFQIRLRGGLVPELRVLDTLDGHRLFQLDTVSVLGATDFHDPIDQLCLLRGLRWHARHAAPAAAGPAAQVQHH